MADESGKEIGAIDSSPEALMKRFERRAAFRRSPEGKKAEARRIEREIIQLGMEEAPPPKTNSEPLVADRFDKLAEVILLLEQRLTAGQAISEKQLETSKEQVEVTKEQMEQFVAGGYDGFVSAENAQVAIDPRLFETQQPIWYRKLSDEWQEIVRHRTMVLLGCYVKRTRGHIDLAAVAENTDVRVDRGALVSMWSKMPGFRIAMATLTRDLFQIKTEQPLAPSSEKAVEVKLMVLKDEAFPDKENERAGILNEFADYKRDLIGNLKDYFEKNPTELTKENGGVPEDLTPETAARAAVASAWNLFFVGNAIDSGDQGDLSNASLKEVMSVGQPASVDSGVFESNPTAGRKAGNPIVYAEQIRAMMLPFDKAWAKSVRGREEAEIGEVGTEETWLGDLGDYIAERNRHDPKFKTEFMKRQRRIVPQRLFASLFDMTAWKNKVRDPKTGKDKEVKVTVGERLCTEKKDLVSGEASARKGLWDFSEPEAIDFGKLKSSELWGAYADSWDSARKIYEMLGGKAPLKLDTIGPWRQTLATAITKMRRTPIGPYFYDPELLMGCIAGSAGLVEFSNDYLLSLAEEEYDVILTMLLDEDRLFYGMDAGRSYVLNQLNAFDEHSYGINFMGRRRRLIRLNAGREAKRRRAK